MQTFAVAPKIYSGEQSLAILKRYRQETIWIVCDAFLAKSPAYTRLTEQLQGNTLHLYSDIQPDPSIATVVAGLEAMLRVKPTLMIGFGGGSAIDAGKAMRFFARQMGLPDLPYIAIPTTSGTGSEVTSATVISDPARGIKYPLFEDSIYPDIAILDPALVVSVPPAITANTGMDVLTHALEAYVSTHANDFTDALAEKATRLVFEYLPTACRKGDCVQTRGKMHNASAMAGMAFSQAGLGLNHAIAHQLGGQFHVAHGLANAMLLPHVIEFNARHSERALKRYARMAALCHLSRDDSAPTAGLNQLLNHIRQLARQIGIPDRLSALKIPERELRERMPAMVSAALADATLPTNPCPVQDVDIRHLLESLL